MSTAKKILIVDDDEAFSESNRDLLEACGFMVYTASNGDDGVRLAREILPDLMILDVMMRTETEGFEVARRIAGMPELAKMGILLVTGVTRAMRLPADLVPDKNWLPVDRVLEKPIVPDHLILEIERVLKARVETAQ
jgi:two-component system, OmpR family, alkaline phosphatase synthesis response regulator PhoP